jgi:hypothetical protein
MLTTESLTVRQQQALEHLRKARERGSNLVEYCSAVGLEVKDLYMAKQQLVRKGVLPRSLRKTEKPDKADKAGTFVPVRIVSPASMPMSPAVSCRLVHPSGWVIECGEFPPASWMAAVLAGGTHAAPQRTRPEGLPASCTY